MTPTQRKQINRRAEDIMDADPGASGRGAWKAAFALARKEVADVEWELAQRELDDLEHEIKGARYGKFFSA